MFPLNGHNAPKPTPLLSIDTVVGTRPYKSNLGDDKTAHSSTRVYLTFQAERMENERQLRVVGVELESLQAELNKLRNQFQVMNLLSVCCYG